MENAFILRNERGLFISDGEKIYFPDRSFKDAEVGLVRNLKVTKDKGTYAFVTGEMVRGVKFSDGEKENIIKEKCGKRVSFFETTYLDTDVLIVADDEGISSYISGGFFCKIVGKGVFASIRLDCKSINANKYSVLSWLDGEEQSYEQVMISLVNAYANHIYSNETVCVFGNRVANISLESSFFRVSDGFKLNLYDDAQRDELVSELLSSSKSVVYTKDQVIDWARENHVIFTCFGDRFGTASIRFRFGDSFCDLKMFGGYKLTEAVLKDEALKKEVADSCENFERWIKNIGKICSGRMLDQVSKIMRELKVFRGY